MQLEDIETSRLSEVSTLCGFLSLFTHNTVDARKGLSRPVTILRANYSPEVVILASKQLLRNWAPDEAFPKTAPLPTTRYL